MKPVKMAYFRHLPNSQSLTINKHKQINHIANLIQDTIKIKANSDLGFTISDNMFQINHNCNKTFTKSTYILL